MRSKLTLLALALVFSPLLSIAQKISDDFEVSSGDPYKVVDAGIKDYVSMDNGTVVMLKMHGDKFVMLQKYDVNAMKETARNEYTDMPKYSKFLQTIKLQDKLFLIFSAYDKSDKENKHFSVYAREINPDDATFGESVMLFETSRPAKGSPKPRDLTKIGWFGAQSVFTKGPKFIMKRSFDESKIMVYYVLTPAERDNAINKDVIGFHVFDYSMKKVWGQEVEMPYVEDDMKPLAVTVASNGDAKVLIANKTSNTYETITVNSGGEVSTNNTGVSTEKAVMEFQMTEDESGNFNCGGLYAVGFKWRGGSTMATGYSFVADGIMYLELGKDGALISNKEHEFPAEFIKQNLSKFQSKRVMKREKKGKKVGIFDLNLRDMVIKEDGSVFFLAERQRMVENSSSNNSMLAATTGVGKSYTYYFSNMIVVKMNPDGSLGWLKKMPKNQKGENGVGQMSYSHMEGEGADYVTYVDNPKNIALSPDDGVPAVHMDGKGGWLTTYKFDHATGKLEKHTLLDLNAVPGGVKAYQMKAARIFKVGKGTFLMEIYIKGKEDTMVKIKLK